MKTQYKCALRHSNTHCPIYFDCFKKEKCNSKCAGFIPSVHKCKENKNNDGVIIKRSRGLGNYVQSFIEFPCQEGCATETVDIIYCPYCGERVTFGVTALKVSHERFINESDKTKNKE